MITSIITKIKNKIVNLEYDCYLRCKRKRLENKRPTIISNNCVGGVIYHDLGLEFTSPTVNVGFKADDFISFLENMEYYLSQDVIKVEKPNYKYFVGSIGDMMVDFGHYKSFEEAKAKWIERKKRLDYDNIYVVMTERDGCSLETIERFENLKLKHKVLITHIPLPQFKSTYYMPGFENESELGVVTDFKPGFWRRRYIDSFDYVRFFNTGSIN